MQTVCSITVYTTEGSTVQITFKIAIHCERIPDIPNRPKDTYKYDMITLDLI